MAKSYKTDFFKLERNYDILISKYSRANAENVKLKKEVDELNKFIEETVEVVQKLEKEYKELELKYTQLVKVYTAIIVDCEQLIKEGDVRDFKGRPVDGVAVYDK